MISSALSKTTRLAACLVAAGFLFATPAVAQNRLPPPNYSGAADVQDRIEELERQLTEATAENERLQLQVIQRDREINRLRGMVGQLAGVNQGLQAGETDEDERPPSAPQQGVGGGGGQGDELAGLNDAQRRATGSLGSAPVSARPAPPPPVAVDPAEAYARARQLLVNGNYAEAEVAFETFLEQHPDAPTAADARFWFAFTQLARNNYEDAAANFLDYLRNNGQAARAPEAQVRLGMALVGMGQQQQGCSAFASLARRYPSASRAVRDLAAREAAESRCA